MRPKTSAFFHQGEAERLKKRQTTAALALKQGPRAAMFISPRTILKHSGPEGPFSSNLRSRSCARHRALQCAPLRSAPALIESESSTMRNNETPRDTESLIAETLTVRLALGASNALPYLGKDEYDPPKSEADKIQDFLEVACNASEDTVFNFRGRAFKFVKPHPANPGQGTQLLSSRAGAKCAAQIVFAPVDEPSQHIAVRYALVPNSKPEVGGPEFFLEAQGNPTTILVGNNVLPVTVTDPETGEVADLPSSAPHAVATLNRVLFEFLKALYEQMTVFDDGLFSAATAQAISRGDFTLVRIQWCCYYAVEDVPRFLQFLTVIFGHTITTPDGIIDLATLLGLRFNVWTDRRTHRVTGVLFEKRHGKNSVFSLVFYDKQKRVAHMRQGKTLTDPETALIQENVRFDTTAHGPGIMDIISEARRVLKKRRKLKSTFLDDLPAAQFLGGTPEQTAWWFERAVHVLTHRVSDGRMQSRSFANWLIPRMINSVLRLPGIVNCTPERLRAFLELDDPIVKAWHAMKKFEPIGWAKQLSDAAGVSKTTVYARQKEYVLKFHIDIGNPYAFYRDLEFFGPNSYTKPENRAALTAAIGGGEGDETLRLLAEASDNFFAQVENVVGKAISNPPALLPIKLAGAMSDQPKPAIGGASSGGRSVPLLPAPIKPAQKKPSIAKPTLGMGKTPKAKAVASSVKPPKRGVSAQAKASETGAKPTSPSKARSKVSPLQKASLPKRPRR